MAYLRQSHFRAKYFAAAFLHGAVSQAATEPRFGGWFSYPKYRRKTEKERRDERIALGIIPPDVEQAIVRAVETTIEARSEPVAEIDLQAAEMELRAYLAQVQKDMVGEYLALIALEFARIEQEREDAQIAMMLFEM